MQKKRRNIIHLSYYFTICLNGYLSFQSCITAKNRDHNKSINSSTATLDLRDNSLSKLPDIVSDDATDTSVTSLTPKSYNELPMPDIIGSHSQSNQEEVIPIEIPSLESTFGSVYPFTLAILNPMIESIKRSIVLYSKIHSEEESLRFEKELNEKLEETLKEYPDLIRLKEKLEKDMESAYKATLEQELSLPTLTIDRLKILVELLSKYANQAENISVVSEQEVKKTLHTTQEANNQEWGHITADCDIGKALDETVKIVQSEQNKLIFWKNYGDNFLLRLRYQGMVEYNKKSIEILAEAIKSLQEAIENHEFIRTNISVADLKTVMKGEEITFLKILEVATKSAKNALEFIKKEVERLKESKKTLEAIQQEIRKEVDRLQKAITNLEDTKQEIRKRKNETLASGVCPT